MRIYAVCCYKFKYGNQGELVGLNDIGSTKIYAIIKFEPTKVDAVIEYRKTNKFRSTKDVKNVNGTRYKTYESLKRYVG